VYRSWEYINRSQTHGCGNWERVRAVPFLGIYKWDFRCSAGTVLAMGVLLVLMYSHTRSAPKWMNPSSWCLNPSCWSFVCVPALSVIKNQVLFCSPESPAPGKLRHDVIMLVLAHGVLMFPVQSCIKCLSILDVLLLMLCSHALCALALVVLLL
jgi:hypothetical protein